MVPEGLNQNYNEAWVGIIYGYGRVAREVNRQLRKANAVGLEMYDALLVLEDAPNGSLDMSTLAEKLLVSLSGVSRLVSRMHEKGFVAIKRSEENHRYKLISITEEGMEARQSAWEIYSRTLQKELGARITLEEARTIGSVLAKLA